MNQLQVRVVLSKRGNYGWEPVGSSEVAVILDPFKPLLVQVHDILLGCKEEVTQSWTNSEKKAVAQQVGGKVDG